jgi:hypothetical protein
MLMLLLVRSTTLSLNSWDVDRRCLDLTVQVPITDLLSGQEEVIPLPAHKLIATRSEPQQCGLHI